MNRSAVRKIAASELERIEADTLAALEVEGVSTIEVAAEPAPRPLVPPSHTGGGRWLW
jgi:hypothetical protein